ncbi:hypothetical protein AAG906_013206 [Vitis piasezkii]
MFSRRVLSKIAFRKDMVEFQVNPLTGFEHKVTDNLQRWVVEVNGALGTLYANELYQLQTQGASYGKRPMNILCIDQASTQAKGFTQFSVMSPSYRGSGLSLGGIGSLDDIIESFRLHAPGGVHMLYPWISTGQSSKKTNGFGMRTLEFDKTVNQKEGHTAARHFQAMHLAHDMSHFLFISRTQDDGSH